jgi:hypothetical protein
LHTSLSRPRRRVERRSRRSPERPRPEPQPQDLIALVWCGTLCGADSYADIERFCVAHQEWFEQFLELPHGIPAHDTLGRVFARLDPEQFQQCLGKWVAELQQQLAGETVAIDGNVIERFFGRIKQCRRVATRSEKKAVNFAGFAWLAAFLTCF